MKTRFITRYDPSYTWAVPRMLSPVFSMDKIPLSPPKPDEKAIANFPSSRAANVVSNLVKLGFPERV